MHARISDNPTVPVRENWLLLIPLALSGFVLIGGMLVSLTVYTAVMQARFGWNETELGAGPVALLLGMSVANLAAGPAMQRLGVRAIFAGGCLVAAAGWAAAGSVTQLWQFMVAMGLAGFGAGAATIVPGIAVITSAFRKNRGLAIALFIGSCALASSAMPIFTAYLIETVGWRTAFRIVGMAGVLLCPLLVRFLPGTLSISQHDECIDPGNAARRPRTAALRLPAFWILTAALTVSQLCMNGVLFNIVAFLRKNGLTDSAAVDLYSLTNFMSLPGLLIGGLLSDRVSAHRLLPAIVTVQALGTFALLGIGHQGAVGLFATIGFVVLWGGVAGLPSQSASLLLGELVGPQSFGSLLGIVFTINGFVGALAPVLTGWLHDVSGSYILPFGLFAACLLAAALACRLGSMSQPNSMHA